MRLNLKLLMLSWLNLKLYWPLFADKSVRCISYQLLALFKTFFLRCYDYVVHFLTLSSLFCFVFLCQLIVTRFFVHHKAHGPRFFRIRLLTLDYLSIRWVLYVQLKHIFRIIAARQNKLFYPSLWF